MRADQEKTPGPAMGSRPHSHRQGVRAVAMLEMLKGLGAVIGAFLIMSIRHRDLGNLAEDVIFKLHLNPTSQLPWWFIDRAYDISAKNLWWLIGGAFVYACIRFTEGYGLWRERVWAEWFALVSGALYIPVEIYELFRHADALKWAVLFINIGIVIYMAYIRLYDPGSGVHHHGKIKGSPRSS